MAGLALLKNLPKGTGAFSEFVPKGTSGPSNSASGSGNGITRIQLDLDPRLFPPPPDPNQLLHRITRTLRAILVLPKDNEPLPIPESYEAVYTCCKILVQRLNRANDVVDRTELEFEKALVASVKAIQFHGRDPFEWLTEFSSTMKRLNQRIALLTSILYELERSFLLNGKPTIKDIWLRKLELCVYKDVEMQDRMDAGLKQWLTTERDATPAQREKASDKNVKAIEDFVSVVSYAGFFTSHIVDAYVRFTEEYYTAESTAVRKKFTAAEYFEHCRSRLDEEYDRANVTGEARARDRIIKAVEQALLPSTVVAELLPTAMSAAFQLREWPIIGTMYYLCNRVDCLEMMVKAFGLELQSVVTNIIKDVDRDQEMVARLLKEQNFVDAILRQACHERALVKSVDAAEVDKSSGTSDGSRPFGNAARDAFERGFLGRKRKPAEMIAKYVDNAMRKGQREESEEDFWEELDGALHLYRYTQDKDVFRTFYERGLAKRLLLQRSASDDLEQRVINHLKEDYDPEFGKGNDMFKDMALSRDLMEEYLSNVAGANDKVSLTVLKFSSWPFAKYDGSVNLPTEISEALATFTAWYQTKHKAHKLDWNHGLGTVTLTTRFSSGVKELSVSTYQAAVLLLFQDEDRLRFTDILERSGIKRADLVPTLQSLALGKVRVLTKVKPGKDITDSDEFMFKRDFEDKRRKIHIPGIQQQETVEETKQIEQAIDLDRQASIDAAVVRLMKSHKKLRDEDLKTKTIAALQKHFVPSVQDIKKRIDYLLEKEYMERDAAHSNIFHYVA